MSRLFTPNPVYKPFFYPWAYQAWLTQQQIHWIPEEVPMADDVKDWNTKLTENEKELLTQIFRFFTQSDVEVHCCYVKNYLNLFQPNEIKMMLTAFANIETIHIAAYAHLLDTIGMPEKEYSAFLEYKEMKEKWEYLQTFNANNKTELAVTLAVYGAFVEGLQLFASFAMLLNFPRFNKMKGMGQIISWSVRDESLHVESIIKLYHTVLEENTDIDYNFVQQEILKHEEAFVHHEDLFIDLAFAAGEIEGMVAIDIKNYIRYIADRRFMQLKMPLKYNITKNPIPWIDMMLNGMEYINFFENRGTEYSKAATQGKWEDIF